MSNIKLLQNFKKFICDIREKKAAIKEFQFWRNHKKNRCKQIQQILKGPSNYRFKFRCDNPNAPEECQKLNGTIEPVNESQLFTKYKSCRNRPRCFCTVTTRAIRK